MTLQLPVRLNGDTQAIPGTVADWNPDEQFPGDEYYIWNTPSAYLVPALGQLGSWYFASFAGVPLTKKATRLPRMGQIKPDGGLYASTDGGVSWVFERQVGPVVKPGGASGSWDPLPANPAAPAPSGGASGSWDATPAHAADGERESAFGLGLFVAGIAALLLLGGKRPKFLR